MAEIDHIVAGHYTSGTLLARIEAGLAARGVSLSRASAADLKPVDEFHIGGLTATEALLEQIPLTAGMQALDIGCGIGGTARLLAGRGLDVDGVDITPEFVETAQHLAGLLDLPGRFAIANALDLPFANDRFDLVTMLHVGMNIPDKPRLFAEAARVLRMGGMFAVYDVMRDEDGPIAYPLPWASAPEGSYLAPPGAYSFAAAAAGFSVQATRPRGDFARAFFARLTAQIGQSGAPPVGLPLIMGADAPVKIANMVRNLEDRRYQPVEMILRKG
ncbi:MAG: class I SAM-dependent methyltransferase [Pseudomonadota bacterium]